MVHAWSLGKRVQSSWRTWQGRLGQFLAITAAFAAVWYGRRLSLAQLILTIALGLGGTALLLRLAGLRFCGPVLVYDLVRSARHGRQVMARTIYAVSLLTVVVWCYAQRPGEYEHAVRGLFAATPLSTNALSSFASSFFAVVVTIQMLAVYALTPAYTAGVIAQEKQRGTLDAMLATDLRNHEIILGLLMSRLASLALLVVTGLPVVSLMLLCGGVDPAWVLAVFAATGLTMASLGSLGILQSVSARRPRDAVLRTYLIVIAFLVLTALLHMARPFLGALGWNGALTNVLIAGDVPLTIGDVLEWPCLANPLVLMEQATSGVPGSSQEDLFRYGLRDYSLFHILIALLCITAAIVRLRTVADNVRRDPPMDPTGTLVKQKKPRRRKWPARLARKGMFWKETVVEARPGKRTPTARCPRAVVS